MPSGLPVSKGSPAPTFPEKQPFFLWHLHLDWHQAGLSGEACSPRGAQGAKLALKLLDKRSLSRGRKQRVQATPRIVRVLDCGGLSRRGC